MIGFLENIISALFPKRCIFCKKTVKPSLNVCPECFGKLSFNKNEISPEAYNKHEFDCCVSPFFYEGLVREGIIAYKFRARENSAEAFAEFLEKTVRNQYDIKNIVCVTAVPLSRAEKAKRGYNQSEIFAKKLAKKLAIPYSETLIKIKDIKPQRTLGKKERHENVKGAFEAKDTVKGTVLLCDDIITTGATLDSCAEALKKVGAEKVLCAAIASTRYKKEEK